jgi:hypothetical protein
MPDGAREVIGAGGLHEEVVPLVARRFYVYRDSLPVDSDEAAVATFNSTFEALGAEFERAREGPIGLCVMAEDPAQMERHPEPVWPGTELMFAGYLSDGRQLRIRYFWGAEIAPGYPNSPSIEAARDQDYSLEERYRIVPIDETDEVTLDDVVELWTRERAVPAVEAQRRVGEVQLVAIEREQGLAGLSTAYLQRNPQLRMPLWYYRSYVASAHRMGNLATQLLFANRDLLERRFVSGEDTRGGGIIFELENQGLQRHFNKALWLPSDFTFVGENAQGAHVRVHYFPGARVPPPRSASSNA